MGRGQFSISRLAFCLALLGVVGVFLSSSWRFGAVLALFGPVAIILGIIGRFLESDRLALWAVVIGFIVSLYLPTLWLRFFVANEALH